MAKYTVQNFSCSIEDKREIENPIADLIFPNLLERKRKVAKGCRDLDEVKCPLGVKQKRQMAKKPMRPCEKMKKFSTNFSKKDAVGKKFLTPKNKAQKRLALARRQQRKKLYNFCEYDVWQMQSAMPTTRLDINLATPSAEIKEAKVPPRRASATSSTIYPDPPTKQVLNEYKPKSGTIINEQKRKRRRHKVKQRVEDLIPQELATILEMEEEEGGAFMGEYDYLAGEDNYLTRQFKKKVSQMSKSTSYKTKDFEMEGEDDLPEEDEDKFISVLTQKFRRDSEINRYAPKKRKIKSGTFENFSFTKLKQPTLKSFFYGVKIGTVHQGSPHFSPGTRNNQGICMPVAAYCYSILKHPDKWTQADVDEVLQAGNILYIESAGLQHLHAPKIELNPGNLQKYCKLGRNKIRFKISGPMISGTIRSTDKKIYNLTKAINLFFTRFKAGILQADNLNIVLWKDKSYYFFDATPRTIDLYSNTDGSALLANFYDTMAIITVLLKRSFLENLPFVIYSIKCYGVLKREAEEIDSSGAIPETNNFQVLGEEKAIVQGSFDLADKCFGFSRNKQAVTIAAVALVYSKITPPAAWHKGTVDKIMTIGNQLFLECIEDDVIDNVGIQELPAVFTIGPYIVEILIKPNFLVDLMYKKNRCRVVDRFGCFFEKATNALVEFANNGSWTLAIWKQRDVFYCFDPYSRGHEGVKTRDGVACITMHTTLDSLQSMLAQNLDSKDFIFHIHALKVCRIHRDAAAVLIFPKCLSMDEYPIEDFKRRKIKKSQEKAVTVEMQPTAVFGDVPDASILEVGSRVRSIDGKTLPVIKPASHPIPKPEPSPEEFVANLDSPSLSDTQIEPPALEETETEIGFEDLDDYALTQEEIELVQRGEGEGFAEDTPLLSGMLPEEDFEQIDEEAGEDWCMMQTDFTQIGSQSLLSRVSAGLGTDIPLEIPDEEVPEATRNLVKISEKYTRIEKKYVLETDADMTLSQELHKETNFWELPDDSQIVLGTLNLAAFGNDLEIMAPFMCIMATAVAKKYAIDFWTKEIVDYVLKTGAELYKKSDKRFDESYKFEIPKISLGNTDFSIKVNYVCDTFLSHKVLSLAIRELVYCQKEVGILVTPTYSCALFCKNNLYYLYDGFGNNEVGLSKGSSNEGVACMLRFKNLTSLVCRILHNKAAREDEENIEYNRFVMSCCYVTKLIKEEYDDHCVEQGEDGDSREIILPVKKKEPEEKPSKKWYQQKGKLEKIQGTRGLGGGKKLSDVLTEDFFVNVAACLLLLNLPLRKWDNRRIDSVLEQGSNIYSQTNDVKTCTKKYIKNILMGDYLFDIVVRKINFWTYNSRKTLKSAIDSMINKKHEHFIIQFPNRSYLLSIDEANKYHLFDPNDKMASWTKYDSCLKLLQRLQSGVIKGGEGYNFHSFEITSVYKAPREVLISNRAKEYKIRKRPQSEKPYCVFHEKLDWLAIEPVPWSWQKNKTQMSKWYHWFEDYAHDLYSLCGNLSPLDERFLDSAKKQTLGNLVVVVGMLQIYNLAEWTVPIMDSILIYGDIFFKECISDIKEANYEITFSDVENECVIFPYTFKVKFCPVIEGTLFLLRAQQYNLFKALRFFFEKYERRFGVIVLTQPSQEKKLYAFGKTHDSEYFIYDCETLGPPMFNEEDMGVPYVLRATTFNRLVYVMTLTLRSGDFFIFEVLLSEFRSLV